MESLGGLAVAARDIRALGTARSRVAPPRSLSRRYAPRVARILAHSGDSPAARPRLALPVHQGDFLRDRSSNIHRRDGLCDTYRPWRPDERSESRVGRASSPGGL